MKAFEKVDNLQYQPCKVQKNERVKLHLNGGGAKLSLKMTPSLTSFSSDKASGANQLKVEKDLFKVESANPSKHESHIQPTVNTLLPALDLLRPSLPLKTSNRLGKCKINEPQITALEAVFKQKQYLNQFEKDQLSNLLSITPLQVLVNGLLNYSGRSRPCVLIKGEELV